MTAEMGILPGVLGPRTVRRTVKHASGETLPRFRGIAGSQSLLPALLRPLYETFGLEEWKLRNQEWVAGIEDGKVARMRHGLQLWVRVVFLIILMWPGLCQAWHDETHIAIAKAAGYYKWFNATGADMAKIKAGMIERHNHYVNNSADAVITVEMVLDQLSRYDQVDPKGHLYGAIIASLRNYIKERRRGKYGEYHLAFCAHYVGDLSQPLHNTVYDDYNREFHDQTDGVINDEILDNLQGIKIYDIAIDSEEALAKEIARIAKGAMALGYKLRAESRQLRKQEAYVQVSQSASLFKAILAYVEKLRQ